MEYIKLQTMLVILGIVAAILNIVKTILEIIEKMEARQANTKAHNRQPGKPKRK